MAERAAKQYLRLFEVRLLHHYWLDEGGVIFDLIGDPAKKGSRLGNYDVRPVLALRPTPATEQVLASYQCLFIQTALGFTVVAPADAQIPGDTALAFTIAVKDGQFSAYTALTLPPQQIYEFHLRQGTDDISYRYKENVPVLSNLSGTARSIGADTLLFLSRDYPPPSANDRVEALVRTGGALVQLTSDGPAPVTQQLAAQAADWPVFLHQGDVPNITPPAGLSGLPGRGVQLSADIADDVFACLRLTAAAANAAFSFVDAAGKPKASPPIYQVRFKNRSTYWRYIRQSTGVVDATEAEPLPLTFFGNAGKRQKPSSGLVKAEQSGNKIARLISEIYV